MWLKQSTTITLQVGPFLDNTDGVTPEVGLTPAIEVSKDGATFVARNSATAVAHDTEGMYRVELNATDTNTLGRFKIKAIDSGNHVPVWENYMVLPANVFDSLVSTDRLQVHVAEFTANVIDAAAIANGAIDAATFAAGAIDAAAIASNAITAVKIATGAITNAKFAAGAIDAAAIANGAIDAATFAANAIDAAALATDAVNEIRDSILSDATTFAGANINATISSRATPAQVNTEVDTALVDINLDHLMAVTAVTGDVVNNSIIARLTSKSATPAFADYANTTDSLQAQRDNIGSAVGADISADIADIPTVSEFNARTLVSASYFDPAADTVANVTTVATLSGHTAQTGDNFVRLGAPVGADISADIAAIGGLIAIGTGTATSGSTTTLTDTSRTEGDTDYWKDAYLLITSGTTSGQVRLITAYNFSTDTFTVSPAFTQAITTNTYKILASADISSVNGSVGSLVGHTVQTGDNFVRLGAPVGADISADIADIPTVSEFNARTIVSANYFDPTADTVANVTTVATLLGHTAQTGDSFVRLSAPAGASVSADIAAIKAETALIVADTNELQTDDVPGLIAALNDLSAAAVNAEVDTALIDINLDHLMKVAVVGTDVVDNTIFAKLVSKSATADWDDFVNTTDSLQAHQDNLGVAVGADISADIADIPTVSEFNARTLVAASYFDPSADTVATVTTLTGHTAQTGDSFARIGAAGANLTDLGGMATAMKAEVNAEVLDVLQTDTFAEIGQETPAATQSMLKMLQYVYKAWRNRSNQTSTLYQLFNDDATTVDQKVTVSDDATTFESGEVITGP